jgi:hypothetical protein
MTPQQQCDLDRALDVKHGTAYPSPLSHGWRCPLHGTHPATTDRALLQAANTHRAQRHTDAMRG